MQYNITAESAEITGQTNRYIDVLIEADIQEIILAVGEEELLAEIGREKAVEYFDIVEAD